MSPRMSSRVTAGTAARPKAGPPPRAPVVVRPTSPESPDAALARQIRGTDPLPADTPAIITIDGPAGTGKSTVAGALARRLGLDFLDTGAMYRAAAAIVLDHGVDPDRHADVVKKVADADLHFDWSASPPAIMAWLVPMNERIRDTDVSRLVSPIAGIPELREHMVRKQRIIAHQHPRLVTEGRDQGSIVFPDADVKFFLSARPEIRAQRRAAQLVGKGRDADERTILEDIIKRDHLDSTRAVGPLICPEGATTIDTSDLRFDEVVDVLEREVRERIASRL